MHGFSTVDGFVEIAESSAEMIKYIANEPSTGLFYIQHHTKNAVPNVINLKNSVVDKSHETTLHAEDSEDSITMLQSMKDCGFPIADEMIRDIKKSLAVMSTKQPRRGLIRNTSGTQQPGRMSTWRSATWGRSAIVAPRDDDSGGYISTVFKSAREKASNFKWPQLDIKEDLAHVEVDELPPQPNEPPVASASSVSSQPDINTEELPLSRQVNDELQRDDQVDVSMNTDLLSVSDNFDDFRADKEAKLEEWLGGSGGLNDVKEI
ncbi:uncharacterized protein LOC111489457 isoform X1 [Cucurbita maxima]|uniref:Uncharacterized protein LOC111489457 isoform X1 n=2 Tax=Cucurbita maxima TaxID=3661 RepID=A0A6J1JWC1_CUCMA|nr:uncharacterized protein LOC111489457 isoform X1 [Cucurbita maxima]XP_022993445.1 uncharacterized protein LOC111489457 isoform X1 [Cucurbita maxima]XP_022993446.1 uncharacterized protein LOC111489457 isoform X1 [Cucurbita maxima]